MSRSRPWAALVALPVLWLLWYLPSLAEMYWWRGATSYGGPESTTGTDPAELLKLLDPPDWTGYTLASLGASALVLGAALAVAGRAPVPGLVAGVPLTAAGVYGVFAGEDVSDLAGALDVLLPGGPEATAEQVGEGSAIYLGQGLCLLVGGTLLATALWALRAPRRRPLGPLPSAAAGLAALLLGWGCAFEAHAWYSAAAGAALLGLSALLLGWAAGSRRLSLLAPLVCGLPVFVLGFDDLFGYQWYDHSILSDMLRHVLPYDGGEHVLRLREAVLGGGVSMLLLGGALAVAALGRSGMSGGRAPNVHDGGRRLGGGHAAGAGADAWAPGGGFGAPSDSGGPPD